MTLSARTDTILPFSANTDEVLLDIREDGLAMAGAYVYEGASVTFPRHHHDLHQLEYVLQGVLEVETDAGAYILSERQAAWIPAGLPHVSTIDTEVRSVSIFMHPSLLMTTHAGAGIVPISPLLRQMINYACRWPITRTSTEPIADAYFNCLAELLAELLETHHPLSLPNTHHPQLVLALAATRHSLATITIDTAAQAAGLSARSLRRLCDREIGMSWRDYTGQARLMRAAALLADPELSVLQVATRVGFESASAFTRAFRAAWGQPPSVYRRRDDVEAAGR